MNVSLTKFRSNKRELVGSTSHCRQEWVEHREYRGPVKSLTKFRSNKRASGVNFSLKTREQQVDGAS